MIMTIIHPFWDTTGATTVKLMTVGEAENLLRRVLKTRVAKMGEDISKYETQRVLDDMSKWILKDMTGGLGLSSHKSDLIQKLVGVVSP